MSELTKFIRLAAFFLICGAVLAQPPYVYQISHAASYTKYIAPGSIFVIFGDGLGPETLVQAALPLPLKLAGTSVQVSIGGTKVDCPVLYASSGQVAAVLPSNTPAGEGELTITAGGRTGWPEFLRVATSAFGIFSQSGTGAGAGSITSADYKLNTASEPAAAGQAIILWGTGLGAVEGDDGSMPKPGTSLDGVEVWIGSKTAKVLYAGRSGCCAGLDQIVVEVPDVAPGCVIPVSVRRAGRTSNFVSLAMASSGEACKSEMGISSNILARFLAGDPVNAGGIALGPAGVLEGAGFDYSARIAAQLSAALKTKVNPGDVRRLARARLTGDRRALRNIASKYAAAIATAGPKGRRALLRAAAEFSDMGIAAGFSTLNGMQYLGPAIAAALPESGTCTLVPKRITNVKAGQGKTLDAGPTLRYEGPNGVRTITRNQQGQYLLTFSSGLPDTGLPAGMYEISGTGGKDVPAFKASLQIGAPLVWTNKAAQGTIDRSQPLTVTWSGGRSTGHIVFGLTSGNWDKDDETLLACVAEASKGTLTVPAFVLAALPPTERGYAFIGAHPLENRLTIQGLDIAYIANGSSDYKTAVVVR